MNIRGRVWLHRGADQQYQVVSGYRGVVAPDQRTWSPPLSLRSDNGPEYVSKALIKWADWRSLDLTLTVLGKPAQNGLNGSFNGKFRDECLAMEWFRCRAEARVVIEECRRDYNSGRPHSSLKT